MRNHLDGYLEAAEREVPQRTGFFHGLVKLWELPSRSWRFAEELCLEHVDDEKESQEAWAYLARGFQLARRIIFSSSRWWCLWSFRPSRRLRITLGEANSAAGFRSISVSKMQDEHILLYKEQNNKHSRNDIIQWHLIIKGQPFWRFPEPSLYPCKSSDGVLKTAGELCSSGRRLFTASLPGELGENDCFDWELIWISYEFLFGSVGNAKCRRLQAYPSLMRHSLKEYTSQIHHSYKEASCQHIQSTTQLPWFDCSVSWLDAWSLSRLAISQVLCCNRARHLKSNDMLLTVRQQCFHAFCKTS